MLWSLLRWHWIQNIEQQKKAKNQRNRNMKNQNTERRKPSFTKRIGRKCRIMTSREKCIKYNFLALLNALDI